MSDDGAADATTRQRLFYFSGGFLSQSRIRRILDLVGYDLTLGKPGPTDKIAVWGKTSTSARGETVADYTDAQLVYVEDAFLRSVKLGRDGEPPLGLTVDTKRPYFDSSGPSDLEEILAYSPLDDGGLMTRARDAIARLRALQLSKYNDFDAGALLPDPGYVLVIDQTKGDASIAHAKANAATFIEMLVIAQEENPRARIIIKSHPDVAAGHRQGHFGTEHLNDNVRILTDPVCPHKLMEGATMVYTVSSGLGFEAIMAGHKPVVFGQPFYSGWGLTDDRNLVERRQRKLTRAQLFAGVMMLYPKWYDPYHDRLCELEVLINTLEARVRAHRQDRGGYSALGMRLWKRRRLQEMFGATQKLRFAKKPVPGKPALVWARHCADDLVSKAEAAQVPLFRLEDGFIRSSGLGATLTPPLSLVLDPVGIYYDATTPSRLEQFITASVDLPEGDAIRAYRLRQQIIRTGLTKYNVGGTSVTFDAGDKQVILVPGQVEDDASIKLGTSEVSTNAGLLVAVRRDFPDAFLIYKPHPDVEAGLRDGGEVADADLVASGADGVGLLAQVDRVCTMTSLMGFEALMREVPVTCYGAPFYAGWGLTDDRNITPSRRSARPTLDQLVHATLIAYPRYYDPVTKSACPPEVVVNRLKDGAIPTPGAGNRFLSKVQGVFASYAYLWR